MLPQKIFDSILVHLAIPAIMDLLYFTFFSPKVLNVHFVQLVLKVPAVLVVEPDAPQHHRGDVAHQEQQDR